jgi:hypothetical protein
MSKSISKILKIIRHTSEHIYNAPEKMIEQYIDLVDRCPNP